MENNDAHGHIVWNMFKNLPSFTVLERDDGYVNVDTVADAVLSGYSKWQRHEKQAVAYAKGKCLDVGCGAGRILLYLQKKGIQTTGIDTSPLSIKVCRLRGAKHVKIMNINDLSDFKQKSFDTILMFGYNFGLFGSKSKTKRLLQDMYKLTSKNGCIIAESRDPYLTENPIHFEYLKRNVKRGRLPGQFRIRARFMQYIGKWYDYLYVSKKEMKELLKGTGWKIEKFIDSENHKKDGRYFAVIKKI